MREPRDPVLKTSTLSRGTTATTQPDHLLTPCCMGHLLELLQEMVVSISKILVSYRIDSPSLPHS
jgi:hypothetical protein